MDPKDIEKYAKRRTADYKNQLELENEKYRDEIIRLYRQIADTAAFPISISTKDDILYPLAAMQRKAS
jgi:hypothetical protein